jgi:hypothetical protein
MTSRSLYCHLNDNHLDDNNSCISDRDHNDDDDNNDNGDNNNDIESGPSHPNVATNHTSLYKRHLLMQQERSRHRRQQQGWHHHIHEHQQQQQPTQSPSSYSNTLERQQQYKALRKAYVDRSNIICGTPNYIAPELLLTRRDALFFARDMWSLGCVLYWMWVGTPPFQSKNCDVKDTYRRIIRCDYSYPRNTKYDTGKEGVDKDDDDNNNDDSEGDENNNINNDDDVSSGDNNDDDVDNGRMNKYAKYNTTYSTNTHDALKERIRERRSLKNLITHLLDKNQNKRYTIHQVMSHSFLTRWSIPTDMDMKSTLPIW